MKTGYENIRYSDCNSRRKRKLKQKRTIRAVVSVLAVVVIIVVALSIRGGSDNKAGYIAETGSCTTYTTEETTSSSENETSLSGIGHTTQMSETIPAETSVKKENPPEFEAIIQRSGYSAESMEFDQLITVDAYSDTATVNAFEKVDGVWVKTELLNDVSGFVGSQGVSLDASEYASYTPKGMFSLGTGFGICDDPGTGLDYFKVTADSYWVDDVNSAYYNQYVEGTSNKDWTSAEHLIEYSGYYDYCVFIEYNTNPVVPGKGSAFFLHVGESPTAGCVAISRSDMIDTLKWLDKAKEPHILIF